MRFFRLMAITVLLLACVVMGSACGGAKGGEGPQGAKGDTGATGVGIQNVVNNGNGTFTVNLTNGTAYTTDNFTGPKGEKGDTGTQGVQGEPGPNMVAAMGKIKADGTILKGYNVTSCTWHSEGTVYEITLTGITNGTDYVASATLGWGSGRTIQTLFDPGTGHLVVGVIDSAGNGIQSDFSFLVLDATP